MQVGVLSSNFFHRTALVRGSQISKIFEIGPAVPEIWPFLDFGLKMGPKLGLQKKISIFHQNYMPFLENYLACQNYLLNVFLTILDQYRVGTMYLCPEIGSNIKLLLRWDQFCNFHLEMIDQDTKMIHENWQHQFFQKFIPFFMGPTHFFQTVPIIKYRVVSVRLNQQILR